MQGILGATLVERGSSSLVPTARVIADARFVLVYVSASWCGPCRAFTPKLNDWHKREAAAAKAVVVFASLDRDEASFSTYFSHHAWKHALPFGSGEVFANRFGVSGVPSLLVFCAADGSLVTARGVEGVSRGAPAFPWVAGGDLITQRVRMSGLEKAPELNGAEGLVVGVDERTGRMKVCVKDGEVVSVKRERLQVLPA